jgi:putative PIN family toxin of toxin-antitoxin system
MKPKVVLDTNIFIAALRSRLGASFKLLSLIGEDKFDLYISVPLILEYEDVAKRQARQIGLTFDDIDDILNYVCQVSYHQPIFFLWRPFLKDPKDDHVLEVAVEGGCDYIITFNIQDFTGIEQFGLRVLGPKAFLQLIGEVK